uniref:translation initiation factor IF-2-like n=1 Tax=Nyctereutes procyonoides TaxID=34880 RepID=UPI002444E8B7|nr:translation initiation factor IF-2-like [Nyctereutes procyonoides]
MAPGGAAGRAEAQGRGESGRRAAAAPEPRARRAGGAGRGAPIGARASAGAAVWTLKGPGRPARRRGARTRVACAAPAQAAPPRAAGAPGRAPLLPSQRAGPAPQSRAEPPCAGKSVPESNLGAFQLRHRGGGGAGGGPEAGTLGAPTPPLAAERLPPAPLRSPRRDRALVPQPRSPPPTLWPGLL